VCVCVCVFMQISAIITQINLLSHIYRLLVKGIDSLLN